jgi:T3SS negative regulator,GrlR
MEREPKWQFPFESTFKTPEVSELTISTIENYGAIGISMSEVKNGLYSIRVQMTDGGRGRATGVLVLLDGTIMGGDTHFYYTGFYKFSNGKWRGELTTRQHAEAIGSNPVFGGREVTCGFTGVYSDHEAMVDGTALVGKASVSFTAKLVLKSAL